MKIQIIKNEFCVCKVKDTKGIDLSDEFLFVGKTDEEISVVCRPEKVPQNFTECEKGWSAMRICGVLDFSLIGILARIAAILADKKIGIFVVSTFNTDYILVKSENLDLAVKALFENGYEVIS